jgi:hypothetical protein
MMHRYVHTIFCDDIRHEIGGKASLIGVYSGILIARQLPITLPMLCLRVIAVTPADQPFRSLAIRVLKDNDTLAELPMDERRLSEIADQTPSEDPETDALKLHRAQFEFRFSPIAFDSPCVLRVRVQTEAGELRGPGLKVAAVDDLPNGMLAPAIH